MKYDQAPLTVARLAMMAGASLSEAAALISVSAQDLDLAFWKAMEGKERSETTANSRLVAASQRQVA